MTYYPVEDGLYFVGGQDAPLINASRSPTRIVDNTRVYDPVHADAIFWKGVAGTGAADLKFAGNGFLSQGSGVYAATNKTNVAIINLALAQINGTYGATVKVASIIASSEAGGFFQQDGSTVSGYALRVTTDSADNFFIDFVRINAGAITTLGAAVPVTAWVGDTFALTCIRSGATFTCSYSKNNTQSVSLFGGTLTDNAPLNSPGYLGVRLKSSNATSATTGLQVLNVWQSYPTITFNESFAPSGTPVTLALTGSLTNWTSATTSFSVSGGSGASIASAIIHSTTSATITLNPGSLNGPLTLSDNTAAPDQASAKFYVKPDWTPDTHSFWSEPFLVPDGSLPFTWRNTVNGASPIATVQATGQAATVNSGGQPGIAVFEPSLDRHTQGPDYYVQAALTKAATGQSVGLVGKYFEDLGGQNGIYGVIRNNASITAEIYQAFEGVPTQIASVSVSAFADGDTLRMEFNGATVRLLHNGAAIPGATANMPDGFVTLCGQCGVDFSSTGGSVTNWEVGNLPGVINITHSTIGYVSATTARLTFRTSAPASVAVQYDLVDVTNGQISPAVAVDATTDFTGVIDLKLLEPFTLYTFRHVVNGVNKDYPGTSSSYPTFTTLQADNQIDLVVGFGSSHALDQTAIEDLIFADLLIGSPQFMIHLGNSIINDNWPVADPTLSDYRAKHRLWLSSGTRTRWYQYTRTALPFVYLPSAHEFTNDYSLRGTDTYYAPALQAYQEYAASNNPNPYRPGVLYGGFNVADVGFFLTDGRSYRSDDNATDDPNKTLLGYQQINDLKAWLTANNTTLRFKCLCFGESLSAYEQKISGPDSGGAGFTNEINALKDWIQQNGITGVFFISGSANASAVFLDSRNGTLFPEFACSPFHNAISAWNAGSPLPANVPWTLDNTDSVLTSKTGMFGTLTFSTSGLPGTGAVTYSVYTSQTTLPVNTYTVTEVQLNAGIQAAAQDYGSYSDAPHAKGGGALVASELEILSVDNLVSAIRARVKAAMPALSRIPESYSQAPALTDVPLPFLAICMHEDHDVSEHYGVFSQAKDYPVDFVYVKKTSADGLTDTQQLMRFELGVLEQAFLLDRHLGGLVTRTEVAHTPANKDTPYQSVYWSHDQATTAVMVLSLVFTLEYTTWQLGRTQ